MSKRKKVFIGIIVLLILLQLVPTEKNQSAEVPATDFVKSLQPPEEISILLHNACYDCHSNHTDYPWYSKVQPFGLLLQSHIRGAKQELNFSEFAAYPEHEQKHLLEHMVEHIEDGTMPMRSYRWMHPEARWSEAEKRAVVEWVRGI
ncbi:MAG TPA: hypothetical protein ENJ45_06560 [Phaeodactylibacter sp.]|nr:hypothetical protein [Phaeodactylibacter sp.]